MFSREDLERIKHDTQEPGRIPARNQIVDKVLPLAQPVVARKQPVKYSLDDPTPLVEPEAPTKTEPVAAPVPVKKKKVIITDINTGIRKVEYR
jgi:hypothetical protein